MTNLQKIQLAMSEKRQRLNELLGIEIEERSESQQAELSKLTGEIQNLEPELRAAFVAEPDPVVETRVGDLDSEARERRDLCARASVGDVLMAVLEKRSCDGATLEAQQAFGCGPNQIPLDMLRVEHRAVTTGPTGVETVEADVVQPVFSSGEGAFLGIDRPTVPNGDAVFPVLSSRPTVGGPHSDDTDVAETTGAFDADLLAPQRIQASFIYKRTDVLRFGAMDSSLRMALNAGLEEKLDYEGIAGASGLLKGANLANHNVAAVTAFADYISTFCYARVDGRYAPMQSDLRVLMGAGTYAHAGTKYRSNNADYSALDSMMSKTGGVRVSAHVPAVVNNKQNALVRLGLRRDMVQPIWVASTIVLDEFSRSGAGEIEVTAVLGMNTKILRADGFYKQQTQHA